MLLERSWLEFQHQPAAASARAASHHPGVGFALSAREHHVAVIDLADEHAHLARAAQTLLTIALHVDVRRPQRREQRLVGSNAERDARILQLDLEGCSFAGSSASAVETKCSVRSASAGQAVQQASSAFSMRTGPQA